uniref:Uncharacterized protein n=1 Tax=Anguilla anguilla TaxID=7936 RepID=A0A0E9WRT2_ANGAN
MNNSCKNMHLVAKCGGVKTTNVNGANHDLCDFSKWYEIIFIFFVKTCMKPFCRLPVSPIT